MRHAILVCLFLSVTAQIAPASQASIDSRYFPMSPVEAEAVITNAFNKLGTGYSVNRLESDTDVISIRVSNLRSPLRFIVGLCYGYLTAERVRPVLRQVTIAGENISGNSCLTTVSIAGAYDSEITDLRINEYIWHSLDHHLLMTSEKGNK